MITNKKLILLHRINKDYVENKFETNVYPYKKSLLYNSSKYMFYIHVGDINEEIVKADECYNKYINRNVLMRLILRYGFNELKVNITLPRVIKVENITRQIFNIFDGEVCYDGL